MLSIVLDKSIISCLIGFNSLGLDFIADIISDNSKISNFIADISFRFALISFDKLVLTLFILSFRLLTSVFILIVAFSIDSILLETVFKESFPPSILTDICLISD